MGRSAPEIVILQSPASSVVIENDGKGAPLWRYWGPRLETNASQWGSIIEERVVPSFSPDAERPLSVFPTLGAGWLFSSALDAHRNGRDFAQAPDACDVVWTEKDLAVEFWLKDSVAGIAIRISMRLNPETDCLTAHTQLTNSGEGILDVGWLAALTVPLGPTANVVRHFSGRHNAEFVLNEEQLGRSIWRVENRRGITSHECFPGAVAGTSSTSQESGLAFGAQLAWSGNHVQAIEMLDDGRRQWQLGEWLAPGEVLLRGGQSIRTPEVLLTCSDRGYDGVALNFHREIRKRLLWPGGQMRPRPVHVNTWEGMYFDHNLDEMKALAQAASDVGAERFVLDDGWFRNRNSDRSGLGDWEPDPAKYPDGLDPLVRHVQDLGMEFGLWMEPEMVNPDSELFRAHPDWVLGVEGRERISARNQLVLDLGRSEVVEYLVSVIDGLLRTLPISYLKWDHNRWLILAGGADGRAGYRRQVLAAYEMLERIRSAHPDVEIEMCAGGGGRIDAGIVSYCHRFWASDCLDAVERLRIQKGFLQFMPPEIMGSHVGASPAHSTGRAQSLDFRAAVAATGHFGLELDVRSLTETDQIAIAQWIDFYKEHRTNLHQGSVFNGEAGDGIHWQAHGGAASWLLFVYRVLPNRQRHMPNVVLPIVDRDKIYRVRLLTCGFQHDGCSGAEIVDSYNQKGLEMDGARLQTAGLPVPEMQAESCVIFELNDVKRDKAR